MLNVKFAVFEAHKQDALPSNKHKPTPQQLTLLAVFTFKGIYLYFLYIILSPLFFLNTF